MPSLLPSVFGSLARLPLRAIPRGTPLPIVRGPMRGMWWSAGALNHGCWLGTYEGERRALFERLIRSGDVVFDVGANVGYYTLLSAVLAGPEGGVVAFEPVRSNLALLRRHVRFNGLMDRVSIVEAAVAERPGTVRFSEAGSATGKLAASGGTLVRAVTLDLLVADGTIPVPGVIKIDVEGAELRVLEGARRVLGEHRPRILLELHTPEMDRECPRLLRDLGYRIEPLATWPDGVTPRCGLVAFPA